MGVIDRAGSRRILRGTAGVLSTVFLVDGAASSPGSVTVTVTDGKGTAIVTAAAATVDVDTQRVSYQLTPAQCADVKPLTAAWSASALDGVAQSVTTTAEIVGDVLFSLAEARAAKLGDAGKYSNETILEARDRIAEAFEQILGYSLGLRWAREIVSGRGTGRLLVNHIHIERILAVETRSGATWTAYGADDLADVFAYGYGEVLRESRGIFAAGPRNVRVEYEHGKQPIPLELKQAALALLQDQLIAGTMSERTISITDEAGMTRFAIAGGEGRWFGLPGVDSILMRYSERIPGIA